MLNLKQIFYVYLKIAFLAVIAMACIGVGLPYLISAKSAELFLFGVVGVVLLPIFITWAITVAYRNARRVYEKKS